MIRKQLRLAFLVLLASPPVGCSEESACGPSSALVSRVIDGDTVALASGEKIRYLLVDAPETTGGHDDCYGQQSTAFNRSLVEGREVELRYDRQCTDRYGRLLAYVAIDGRDVSSLLIERGYARVLEIPPNGADRAAALRELESQAEREARGLWGFCASRP